MVEGSRERWRERWRGRISASCGRVPTVRNAQYPYHRGLGYSNANLLRDALGMSEELNQKSSQRSRI